jgi:glyoxylase-like metal-dependent hydrolase (beta-lactamase superfamily II)
MAENPRSIQLGAVTVTLINAGTLQVDLAGWLPLPPEARPPTYAADFERSLQVPVLCFHLAVPGSSILVDACDPASLGDSNYAPPGMASQLAAAGIQPEAIDHLVITHSHYDHYSGLAEQGRLVFPQARHYLGRADWERLQDSLQQPGSEASQTLGLAHQAGRLELVDGRIDLAEGVQIIPAPGETPGHQIVRVQSAGQVLYCLGDLYHHPLEADYPEWRVHWAEAETTQHSRQALMAAAVAEEALLLATHIPTPGRLVQTKAGVVWKSE